MPNTLIHQTSSYLLQHAHDPIQWHAYSPEILDYAKANNKPIFLSIGYSTCHWCHVMQKEVFKDQKLAEKLNQDFIAIKVDKEERPDIDQYYQEVYMLLNRQSGGWPTSIFLTPDAKPFYAATYIPPTRQNNRLGFDELLDIIATKIAQNDTELFKNANEIARFVNAKEPPKEATVINKLLIKNFLKQANYYYDKKHAGFSNGIKFPNTSVLNTLLDIYLLTHDQQALDMSVHTLHAMQQGGMHDLVDGGFCRYSTDELWHIPHFEKMTYDNALLISLYARAFMLTEDETFKHTALKTTHFMLSTMQEDGLYYSASDAQSQGVEGGYFSFGYEEFIQAISKNHSHAIKEICDYFGVTKVGNFDGANILRAQSFNRPVWYDTVLKDLKTVRKTKSYPFIDTKIITSVNAMMIKALLTMSYFDNDYLDKAQKSIDALLDHLYIDETLYHVCTLQTPATVKAFLEDYAYLSDALLYAYTLTFNTRYLNTAIALLTQSITHFYHKGAWSFSNSGINVAAQKSDSSYPSSIAVLLDVLIRIHTIKPLGFEKVIFDTLQHYSYDLMRSPFSMAHLSHTALQFIAQNFIIKSSHTPNMLYFEALKLYPFISSELHEYEEYLICTKQACILSSKTSKDLVEKFKNHLQNTDTIV